MNIIRHPEKSTWPTILKRPQLVTGDINKVVFPILQEVKKKGDVALIRFTEKFDGVKLKKLTVDPSEIEEAVKKVDPQLLEAMDMAIRNIERFHLAQQLETKLVQTSPGVTCWQKAVAIEKVGLYVPGGSAPLFSTVLMLAIPARIAGCSEVVLCSPPDKHGNIHPAVLSAAKKTGITKIYKIGGAQAIAAMAYGTETVPRVYKIFGPGNQYVTAAKQVLSREDVAIDMPAGPSELAVIADQKARADFIAADLLSQAEHGTDSQVMLVTNSEILAEKVNLEVKFQLDALPRKALASGSLENSRIIVVSNLEEAIELVNTYAPEHLIIMTEDADWLAEKVINAGSVFIGAYAPESAGDYVSGTNHTLPTNGYARVYNGVNLDHYVKKITFQQISKEGLENIGPAIMKMAETEALIAHKNSVSLRINL
jgi:histidinol dehydrogenase